MGDGATMTDQTVFAEHPVCKADDASDNHNPISIVCDKKTIHTCDRT
jgi:hypothetical protein